MTTETATPSSSGVQSAIVQVMAELAKKGIAKDRRNEAQNYAFRGIDDMYNALASALVAAKLVIIPAFYERTVVERVTPKGTALFYVTLQAKFLFVAADGSQLSIGPFFGEAMDSGDKATNKAMSAAYKYMAMQTFCIPTEGDNDADAKTHEVAAPDVWTTELSDLAHDAAKRGSKAYREFWRSLSDETRKQLVDTPEHAGYKKSAAAYDAEAAVAQ